MRFFALCFILLHATASSAFSISPLNLQLTPTGSGSTTTVLVKNNSAKDLNVSVFMHERKLDEFGKESQVAFDVKKNFMIIPANVVIKPKSVANVRLVYIGPKDFKEEKSYRLTFGNVNPQPYKRQKIGEKASVKLDMLLSYSALVYLTPEKAKAKLSIEKPVTKNGETFLKFVNNGNARIVLKNSIVKINAKNLKKPEEFRGHEFSELFNSIPPNTTRLVKLPAKSKADPKTLTVEIAE